MTMAQIDEERASSPNTPFEGIEDFENGTTTLAARSINFKKRRTVLRRSKLLEGDYRAYHGKLNPWSLLNSVANLIASSALLAIYAKEKNDLYIVVATAQGLLALRYVHAALARPYQPFHFALALGDCYRSRLHSIPEA